MALQRERSSRQHRCGLHSSRAPRCSRPPGHTTNLICIWHPWRWPDARIKRIKELGPGITDGPGPPDPPDLAANLSLPRCRPSRTRTAVLLRQCAHTHPRDLMCSHSQWMHMALGERSRKLWHDEEVITGRYHPLRTARRLCGPRWTSLVDVGVHPRLVAAPLSVWVVDRPRVREDVRSGLPTALVRALGGCDGRVRAVHAR